MKLRDTVILVVLAHIGLVLVWVCMGGCANDKAQEPKKEVAAVGPETGTMGLPPVSTDITSEEESTLIMSEEVAAPGDISLPTTRTVAPVPEPVETEVQPAPEEIKIVLKKGDTLWALSRKYHVPVSAIVDRNDIQRPELVREGRELWIPVGASSGTSAAPRRVESTSPNVTTALPAGTEALPVAEDAETTVHVVKSGDTIWALARKYGTTSDRIMELNNVADATRIQIGQELRIPKGN